MPNRDAAQKIVVVGASAGGIQAVCALLGGLPADFPFPIFVVVHIGRAQSELPTVLSRCGPLTAVYARNGEPIAPGRVYVAPPNRHLLIEDGRIALSHGAPENRFRPAVDPLFRSAARAYRENVIAIVLSGALDDGTAGAFAVKARGGRVIVQDPDDALISSMPARTREMVDVDHSLPVQEIPQLLVDLSQEEIRMPAKSSRSARTAAMRPSTESEMLVPLVCPDCSGPLHRTEEGNLTQFSCLVGHAYSPASLDSAHADALERAIWIAIRTLKERLNIQQLVSRHASGRKHTDERAAEHVQAIERDVALLKEILERI